MATGMFIGFLFRNKEKLIKPIDYIITWSIFLLLFFLGISVGTNDTIINNLDTIGIKAFFLTIGAVLGSIIVAYFTYIFFFKKKMKNSIVIVIFFICGILCGLFSILPKFFLSTDINSYVLYILMFFVGISVGADKSALKIIKKAKLKILLVPLSVVIGTFIGVGIFSIFIPNMNLRDSLAVGSGFGYYSLSSIFISQISGKTLGVIALLSNILREIITLLFTPIIVKYFGKIAPIASGGATSMDTTLPIIIKFVGKEYAIISIFSGTILTILVPFLVTFILKI
ncbi:MAG: lysine exporter LysO family protein [Candidatus Cloacimonetes bacterium]|nr:lysine exporter LysO family protein [Candidatus Cloacimonadota bacterium]